MPLYPWFLRPRHRNRTRMSGPCRGVEIRGVWETLPSPRTLLYKVELFSISYSVTEGDIKDHFPFLHIKPVVLHFSVTP